MSEPQSKKKKVSTKNDTSIFVNIAGGEPYDQILCVQDTKFAVCSEKLKEHSKFFGKLFTAEKDKNEISVADVDPKNMELFLNVIYHPNKIRIAGYNLSDIIHLVVRFEATEYFWHLSEEKKFLDELSAKYLLSLSEGFPELKDKAEADLMTQYENATRCQKKELYELVKKYNLFKMKKAIKEQVLRDLLSNEKHSERQFDNWVKDFGVKHLQKKMNKFYNDEFNNGSSDTFDGSTFENFLRICKKYDLHALKELICNHLVEKWDKKDEQQPLTIEEYCNIIIKFDIPILENRLEIGLVKKFKVKKDFPYFTRILIHCQMPKLKEIVEEALMNNKLDDNDFNEIISHCECFFTAFYCGYKKKPDHRCFGHFTDTISKYVIDQFEASQNFEHVQFVFLNGFEEFKKCIVTFLQAANLDDPIMRAAKPYILQLDSERKAFILESLMRKAKA